MVWNSWSEFFAMGGYGVYVWGSFVACAIGLCLEWVLIKQQRKNVLKQLRRMALADELERTAE
ncbi:MULTISPECIES: heme exporter protein CcmD [Deefgea]|uniref:Heme exporter protein D n=1 Tax=Deefgea chitinilytica TaxID=570276 RepID=A0ABS2CC12_9NEIS|nr:MULTISPECIES: heme exporter protein CcmD [Deefgea]MBM5571696.1 heme exporter protein CcmD [Deefgea chitinilytica]MBM9888931.1 heme exporter protein CcmD [Deefgea sp. CFH1-16]